MFSVRCQSGVSGPGFDSTGTGLVEESSVAVWVSDVSLTLSSPVHCVGSNARRCPVIRVGFGW